MSRKFTEWFLVSSAVVLFVAAAFVLWASFSGERVRVLDLPDPLLGLSMRWLFRLIAAGALGISGFLLWSHNTPIRLAMLTWFSCSTLLYHLGMVWYGASNLFASLGNLNVGVPLPPAILSPLICIGLVCLLVGSGGLLGVEFLKQWRNRKSKHPRPSAAEHPRQAICPS